MKKILSVLALSVSFVVFLVSGAMAEEMSKSFSVSGDQTVLLQNLFAKVSVKTGSGDSVKVVVSGAKPADDFIVKQESASLVSVKGKGGNNTVSMGQGTLVVSSNGNVTVVSGGSGVVVVNGKVISGDGKSADMPSIEVILPKGTSINAHSVNQLTVVGVNGKLNASVTGNGRIDVSGVTDLKLSCSGQTNCKASQVTGGVRADASGQSSIEVAGNFLDVQADASGQSSIRLSGNCRDFEADASGQSDITMYGKVSGQLIQDSSGMAKISVRR